MNRNTLVIVGIIVVVAAFTFALLTYDQEKNVPSKTIPGNEHATDNSVSVMERPYNARSVIEYNSSIPITHKNNFSNSELKEKLELVRNSGVNIVSSGIDYDVGQLVFYSPDSGVEEDIKKILGDFPFILLYEESPPEWESSGPPPLDSQ